MKKYILSAFALAAAAGLGAQNITDAFRMSENNYYGTARSVAMGNAFTALGGDLGSAIINPAGTAVNGYSQFVITPSVGLLAGSATFNSSPDAAATYGPESGISGAKAYLPNFGFVTVMNSSDKSSILRRFSLGFVGSASAYYMDDMTASGNNNRTSYMGYLAADATNSGIASSTFEGLTPRSYQEINAWYWPVGIAWNTNMISNYTADDTRYVGAAQNVYSTGLPVAGDLAQRLGRLSRGFKYDMVVNAGLNFLDWIYVGANLGIVTYNYQSDNFFREAAVNPADFANEFDSGTTYFRDMVFKESLKSEGTGINLKLGTIITPPGTSWRFGAAIQTPTYFELKDELRYYGELNFTDDAFNAGPKRTDTGIFEYGFTAPFRCNFGTAYVLPGGSGVLSADYEYCNYHGMRFSTVDDYTSDEWNETNDYLRQYSGGQHHLRLGAEYKPAPEVAFRAGYTFATSPERDSYGDAPKAYTHSAAAGIGYSSAGSFFCDFAVRGTFRPTECYYPYPTYDSYLSPEVLIDSRFWDILFTFGWRF